MNNLVDQISVCICTYRRPVMLEHLLRTLHYQQTDELFSFNIIVVDNDVLESAKTVVFQAAMGSSAPICYGIEPEQNISLARNRAIGMADGDFVACIDDDEFADERWLASLYRAAIKYGADGVLGPVVASFETPPPQWVIKGSLFVRDSFPTGTVLKSPKYTRSGNFLMSRKIILENTILFNPEYGNTGGEDSDFFARMLAKNYVFVWCNEALVHETVPADRLTRSYLLKRALLTGVVAAKRASFISPDTLKSLAAVFLYSILLPFLLIGRPHLAMVYLMKNCHHMAKILARCGLKVVKRRPA